MAKPRKPQSTRVCRVPSRDVSQSCSRCACVDERADNDRQQKVGAPEDEAACEDRSARRATLRVRVYNGRVRQPNDLLHRIRNKAEANVLEQADTGRNKLEEEAPGAARGTVGFRNEVPPRNHEHPQQAYEEDLTVGREVSDEACRALSGLRVGHDSGTFMCKAMVAVRDDDDGAHPPHDHWEDGAPSPQALFITALSKGVEACHLPRASARDNPHAKRRIEYH
eukprot:446217-Prymnesium_polylepis.1